jgi:uncharacterized membrane protein
MNVDEEAPQHPRRLGDLPLSELDDDLDREELRSRYYGLLQELRVILPGVQVLLAFLLTAPFAERFPELSEAENFAYGLALIASFLSVICLLTPAVFHRVGERTARSARLRWSIRLTLTGLGLLAVALMSALWAVTDFVFASGWARGMFAVAIVSLVGLWIVLPMVVGHANSAPPADHRNPSADDPTPGPTPTTPTSGSTTPGPQT